ncbi:hypothetical protein GCM10027347_39150 [Larkinella harenae]
MFVRRYYERKLSIRLFLWSVDLVTDFLVWLFGKNRTSPPGAPTSILILTFGHLGDALILSYVFPLIQARYPNAHIDLVAGSWIKPIIDANPAVRRFISVDHIVANRRRQSFLQRVWAYWRSFWQALGALRWETYDYSLDIRYADPPSHFLLPFIRVRKSIGMGTRRYGGLLDHEFFVPPIGSAFHHFSVSEPLFRALGIDARLETIQPVFPLPASSPNELARHLGQPLPPQPFILLFPETGESRRQLSVPFWQELTERMLKETVATLILCGQQKESTAIFQHPKFAPSTYRLIDAVGKLNLNDLANLARQARLALTLESMPAHLCAIFCPVIAFFKNGTGAEFFPIGNFPVTVIHNHKASQDYILPRVGFKQFYTESFETPAVYSVIIQKVHHYYETVYRS